MKENVGSSTSSWLEPVVAEFESVSSIGLPLSLSKKPMPCGLR